MAATTFNIAKSIVGAGVLSLPSGVAFFSSSPTALVPASVLCVIMGIVAAYTFSSIGRACEQHKATSFQEVWQKSVDPKTAWLLSSGITAQCFLASLAYAIIIGDSFSSIAASFNLPAVFAARNNIIIAFSTLVLFPLCSLGSLSALAPFSLLGLVGILYTAVFMAIRFFDKSYAPGGVFYQTLTAAARPVFSAKPYTLNHLVLVLVSMLSTSFVAHFLAPKFYAELKDTSMPRFNAVVGAAYAFSIVMFMFMMAVGFVTFGGASSGFILNNYAGSDGLASLARLAIGGALVTSFPFTFSALRDGVMELFKWTPEQRSRSSLPVTGGLFAVLTGLAIVLKDVGFVVSLSGALFGSAIMFIVPAIMNLCNANKMGAATVRRMGLLETVFNKVMIGSGVLMALLGAAISILRELGKL
jgi:amino acid permease